MKVVDITIQIRLRDYGAFEDLAEELGYPVMDVIRIADTESDLRLKKVVPETPKKELFPTRGPNHFKATPNNIRAIKELRQKKGYESLTHKVFTQKVHHELKVYPGVSTVGHLLRGNYDHLLKKDAQKKLLDDMLSK